MKCRPPTISFATTLIRLLKHFEKLESSHRVREGDNNTTQVNEFLFFFFTSLKSFSAIYDACVGPSGNWHKHSSPTLGSEWAADSWLNSTEGRDGQPLLTWELLLRHKAHFPVQPASQLHPFGISVALNAVSGQILCGTAFRPNWKRLKWRPAFRRLYLICIVVCITINRHLCREKLWLL